MTDLLSQDAQNFMFPMWKKISESYSVNFCHHDAMKFFLKQMKERWKVVLTKCSAICITSVSAEYYAFCMHTVNAIYGMYFPKHCGNVVS